MAEYVDAKLSADKNYFSDVDYWVCDDEIDGGINTNMRQILERYMLPLRVVEESAMDGIATNTPETTRRKRGVKRQRSIEPPATQHRDQQETRRSRRLRSDKRSS
jgi:hypothetical protein